MVGRVPPGRRETSLSFGGPIPISRAVDTASVRGRAAGFASRCLLDAAREVEVLLAQRVEARIEVRNEDLA